MSISTDRLMPARQMTEPKVAKPKKPVTEFSLNCCVTHKELDIRDGGFTPLAGLLAAACMAIWRGWQQPALRKPMLWELTADGWRTGLGELSNASLASKLAKLRIARPVATQP